MRKQLIMLLAAGFPLLAAAQTAINALRLSQTSTATTGRNLGIGGVGGATGADFSSLTINPAGIGLYRSSEFLFTPTLRLNSMNTNYLNTSNSENNTKFNISNFGMVFAKVPRGADYDRSPWKATAIAIGYNRLADFNSKGYYGGRNSESSITEMFAADAKYNGTSSQIEPPPLGFLGYEGYLTDNNYNSVAYQNIISNGGSVNQGKTWSSRGGIHEVFLSAGGNYEEKLMLGGNIGLVMHNYEVDNNYEESDATGDNNNDFGSLSYRESMSTSGVGINLKLGAIYVVNESVRLGASFHSPTWSAFSDINGYMLTSNTEGYKASLGGSDQNPITEVQPANDYQFDYSLRSPWRGVLGATFFLGKKGFVSADYEYAAYNTMKYGFNASYRDAERSINESISNTFKGTHNFRIGIEGKLTDAFAARAGFGYYGSPFKNNDIYRGQRTDFSLGIGYRAGGMFIDLGYMYTMRQVSELGYPLTFASNAAMGVRSIPVGIADINYGNSLVALTIGFKFTND